MAGLRKRRSVLSARVLSSGDKVSRLALPAPVDDTRRRLRRRLNKLLDEKTERVSVIYRIAAEGEEKVAELHELGSSAGTSCTSSISRTGMKSRIGQEGPRGRKGEARVNKGRRCAVRRAQTHPAKPSSSETAAAVAAGRLIKYREFFSGQKSRNSRPKLLESILSLA